MSGNQLSIKVTGESRGKRNQINETRGRETKIGQLLTLELLTSWIRRMNLDEYTTEGLITLASKYPAAALPSFRKNVNLMIQRVRTQRQKDQQGEESEKSKPQAQPRPPSVTDWANHNFDAGPQKVSITEEDIRDNSETEDKVAEQTSDSQQDDQQQETYESLKASLEDLEGNKVEEYVEDLESAKSISEDFH
jgi:hypothetical protein